MDLRVSGLKHLEFESYERIRYTRDQLLQLQEAVVTIPDEIRTATEDIESELLVSGGPLWGGSDVNVKEKTINKIHSEPEQMLGLRAGTTNMHYGRGAPAIGLRGGRKFGIGRPGGMVLGMPEMCSSTMPGTRKMPGMPGTDRDGWEVFPQGRIGSKFESPMSSPAGWEVFPQGRIGSKFESPMSSPAGWEMFPQGRIGSKFESPMSSPAGWDVFPQGRIGSKFESPMSSPAGFPFGNSRAALQNAVARSSSVPNTQRHGGPLRVTERHVPAGKPPNNLDKMSKSLLEEYFSFWDKVEAKLCVGELKWPSYHPEFVRQAVLLAMEKTERHVELVITLLEHLFSDKTLSDRDIKEGIILVAEECDDITIDIPLAPRHLGNIVGKLTFAGATDLRLLKEAMSKVEEDGHVRRTIFEAAQRVIKSNPAAERVLGAQSGDLKECEKLIA